MARTRGQELQQPHVESNRVTPDAGFSDLGDLLHHYSSVHNNYNLNKTPSLGVMNDQNTAPSASSSRLELAESEPKKRSLRYLLPGAAGLALVSVFAPAVAANAAESSNTQIKEDNETSDSKKPTVEQVREETVKIVESIQQTETPGLDVTVEKPDSKKDNQKPVSIVATPEAAAPTTIETEVAAPEEVEEKPVSIVPKVDSPAAEAVPIEVSADATDPKASKEPVKIVPTVPGAGVKTIEIKDIEKPAPVLDKSGKEVPNEPIKIATNVEDIAIPEIVSETATPEQIDVLGEIWRIVKTTGGDKASVAASISAAADLIATHFHDDSINPKTTENGEKVVPTTNAALIEHITKNNLPAFTDTMFKGGHTDPNYSNTTLMTLAVIEAAAKDQSVLNSPDVQQLVAGATRPTDEYQGKLFDQQYVPKAKEALGAENGALTAGFMDSYRPRIESMYTYILLASTPDKQQTAEIQTIKDAEAAEAARLAAEAANGNYANSPEAQAIQNLIDREGDPVNKRAFMIMQHLMANAGINATQAAGMLGDLSVESASTFDPSVSQDDYGGGPGRGLAQWEGSRLDRLREFAAARGTAWDDLYTQLDFMVSELPGRRDTLNVLKGTSSIFDAAKEIMVRYETPRVVVDAMETGYWGEADAEAQRRAERGQPFLDAFNAETGAVTAQRQAEAEAKAKAEAERKAKYGLNLDEANAFVARFMADPNDRTNLGGAGIDCNGGARSNCVSLSAFYLITYTDAAPFFDKINETSNENPGDGRQTAWRVGERTGNSTHRDPRVGDVFSIESENHTGVILGVNPETDQVITGEALCNHDLDADHAYVYSLANWTDNPDIVFASPGLNRDLRS